MGEERPVYEPVEHLFRHETGRMLATLTHIFGLENQLLPGRHDFRGCPAGERRLPLGPIWKSALLLISKSALAVTGE
jgi:hypothetical protein